jgi:hypothetical protein
MIESAPPIVSEQAKIMGIKILLMALEAVRDTADAIFGTQ